MRIFVTGATGFIGSAIVQELIGAGHQVLGLARSDVGAASLAAEEPMCIAVHSKIWTACGVERRAADGVIHTAFIHDFSKFAANCEMDRRAIEALGSALAGSDRPLIVTSGTGSIAPGRLATEDDGRSQLPLVSPRASEEAAASVAARGVRVSVVRLPQVHGDGDHGFVSHIIALASRRKRRFGVSWVTG